MNQEWHSPKRKVLLDSNLLVVLIVGLADQPLLFGKSALGYDLKDFSLLQTIIQKCEKVIVTPYILAEVNSLLNRTGFARDRCRIILSEAIIPVLEEHYQTSLVLSKNIFEVRNFGLTDTSIIEAIDDNVFVVTADGPLYGYLSQKGFPAIFYKDIRHLAGEIR